MGPEELVGMTIGAAIMLFFGTIWLLLGLLARRPSPKWLRLSLLLAGVVMAIWVALAAMETMAKVQAAPTPPVEPAAGPEVGKRFGWIMAIEGGAIVLTVVVMKAVRRPDFILPVIALIVGLHFFPLASLFGAPVYHVTGALGCAIGVAGLVIPEPARRTTIVGLSFGVLLWLTCAAVLVEMALYG